MAGGITETGELYSPYVGLVYMFNLIVGTGALTMPKAFATAGWLVSLVLLLFLGFMSYMTTTFVMEAMAAANAQLRWKRMESHKEEDDDDSSSASDNDVLIQENYDRSEKQPILSRDMDLLIFLKSQTVWRWDRWPLCSSIKAVFTLLLGPFTFFDVQKTKYLQILTSLMRWIAFAIMIILALIRIGHGQGEGHPPIADFSGIRNLFGVCVYSFMCQHSLPSLITPISSKKHITQLVLLDYVLILAFYSLLSFTAIFCFHSDSLLDMYTLNFTGCDIVRLVVIRFFLGLFPVFTISTNFPIIAVTLRNNWKTLFHREGEMYPWVVDRVVFPIITLVPPILVAFCTHDLESLVGITGAYAGNGIQYVIPAFLVYCSRKDTKLVFGYGTVNKHQSPFRSSFWVGFVLVWAFSCFLFVTANIILSETKL
ncbi:transmembrane protein 104 isoform X3 [Monodelphis domestica]|uniref:transmembrane protein 104 isoform X3 n=1 Tax=Monodelphis domestica TaxID=13616 RepID=UPI00044310ED|nr:transmembrane protein 104 isoform X3 [Monodelphis domestica]XP_056673176.1 transmembrane protein 104 isoform X3 [Monodelphis domestica]